MPGSSSPPGPDEARWSGALTNTMWWCRLSRDDVNHIEGLVRGHMLPPEVTVEYIHIEPVSRRQKKTTLPHGSEQRVLRALTLDQLIDVDVLGPPAPPWGVPTKLYSLSLRCTGEGHAFEMRFGTPTGSPSWRIKIHSTWPGREKADAIQQVWTYLHERRRRWWARVATLWILTLSLIGSAVLGYGQFTAARWRDPSTSRNELYNAIGVAAAVGLLAVWIIFRRLHAATGSHLVISPRQRVRLSAGPLKALREMWASWKWKKDVMVVLTALTLLVALLAWLFPLR